MQACVTQTIAKRFDGHAAVACADGNGLAVIEESRRV